MRRIAAKICKKLFPARPVAEDVKSILVIRMNRIGDMVCTIPLLRTLRQEFPNVSISVLAESTNSEIIANALFVDKVYVYKKRSGIFSNRFIEVIRLLNGAKFDLCIGVKAGFSSSLAVMTLLSRARFRVGYVSERFHVFNMLYNIPVKKNGAGEHQILQCLKLLAAINIPGKRFVLDCTINPPASAEAAFSDFLKSRDGFATRKLAVINISNNKPSSEWPAENFIRLINGLGAEDISCLVTSAPADRDRAAMIINACDNAAVYYETPHIMDFAAAVRRADILIGHDSGAMHIGAAAGTKTLVLVGRGIAPEVWGPYGEGHKCIVKGSITDITPEEVTEELFNMLKVAAHADDE